MIGFERGIKIIRFMSENPVFKGLALLVLVAVFVAAAFILKRDKKSFSLNFIIFLVVAAVIFAYGVYILIARPNLWVW